MCVNCYCCGLLSVKNFSAIVIFWECGDIEDNGRSLHLLGPTFDTPFKLLVKFSLSICFNCPSEQGVGCLERQTSLSALQSVCGPFRSCMGGEGA